MTETTKHIIAYTDGGSRGNPGPAAAAFLLKDENKKNILEKAIYLGEKTNNFAEYTAVIEALKDAKKFNAEEIKLFTDSELLVKQVTGKYKVKSEQIMPLFQKVIELINDYKSCEIKHITRDKNKEADSLVNQALNLRKNIEKKKTEEPNKNKIRLGVLISGGGTTLMNILQYIKDERLNAEIPIVISSRSDVKGVHRAENAGLNVEIIRKKDFSDINEFSKEIQKKLTDANVELVIQAGWLCLWEIPEKYRNKVMNIHPALLPSFGGKGMFGEHVHQVVLQKGCKVSGCTVHFCSNQYDTGPVIIQRTVPVKDDDTPDSLAKRVFQQECIAYPQAIKLFADGKISVKNGKTEIDNS